MAIDWKNVFILVGLAFLIAKVSFYADMFWLGLLMCALIGWNAEKLGLSPIKNK